MKERIIEREIKGKKEREIRCKRCGKKRKQFLNIEEYCQVCYRELLEEYSYYDYGVEKSRLRGNSLKICEKVIEEGKSSKEIAREIGLNEIYVRQVIHKNLVRVNSKGERRPF